MPVYAIEPVPYSDSAAAGWMVVAMFFGMLALG